MKVILIFSLFFINYLFSSHHNDLNQTLAEISEMKSDMKKEMEALQNREDLIKTESELQILAKSDLKLMFIINYIKHCNSEDINLLNYLESTQREVKTNIFKLNNKDYKEYLKTKVSDNCKFEPYYNITTLNKKGRMGGDIKNNRRLRKTPLLGNKGEFIIIKEGKTGVGDNFISFPDGQRIKINYFVTIDNIKWANITTTREYQGKNDITGWIKANVLEY
jgi:hypothetical protein